jgi:hypothetical protein
MSPYRLQYNESEYTITNYNFFYKIAQQHTILFIFWKVNRLFTPQNRHAQTFPDTHRVQNSGAHLLYKYDTFWFLLHIYIYIYIFFYIFIRYTIYDIRYMIYDLRYTIYDIRYTKYDIRNTICGGPVGGAPAWPALRAAGRAGRGAAYRISYFVYRISYNVYRISQI